MNTVMIPIFKFILNTFQEPDMASKYTCERYVPDRRTDAQGRTERMRVHKARYRSIGGFVVRSRAPKSLRPSVRCGRCVRSENRQLIERSHAPMYRRPAARFGTFEYTLID